MKEKIPKDIEDLIESQTNPKVHEELKQPKRKNQEKSQSQNGQTIQKTKPGKVSTS
jgi:hypothetical protein